MQQAQQSWQAPGPGFPFPQGPMPFQAPFGGQVTEIDTTTGHGLKIVRTASPFTWPGLVPPTGKNFWRALFKAQSEAQGIKEDGEVVLKKGGYSYASYKAFMLEARRVLHANGMLMFQGGTLSLVRGDAQVYGTFTVVHADSGEGFTVAFEWPVDTGYDMAIGKAAGAAYSNSIRYFSRALLMITTNDGDDPEAMYDNGQPRGQQAQAPQPHMTGVHAGAQAQWPAQQQYQQQYQQPQQDQQHQYGHQQGGGYPQQGQAQRPAQGQPGGQWGDVQHHQQRQAQAAPPGMAGPGQGQQGPAQGDPRSFSNAPAGRPGGGGQQVKNGSVNMHAQLALPGEPTSPEAWVRELQSRGWVAQEAEDLAVVPPELAISDSIREILYRRTEVFYGDNSDAILAAWKRAGFEPDPTAAVRPKPTGMQSLRYARTIDLTNTNKTN